MVPWEAWGSLGRIEVLWDSLEFLGEAWGSLRRIEVLWGSLGRLGVP